MAREASPGLSEACITSACTRPATRTLSCTIGACGRARDARRYAAYRDHVLTVVEENYDESFY